MKNTKTLLSTLILTSVMFAGAVSPMLSLRFNDIANAVIKKRKKGKIEYIPFPKELNESYQSYTQANLKNLRSKGYDKKFISINNGIDAYIDTLC